MLRNEEFDHVLDPIRDQAAANLLFLTRWIPSFRSRCEDFKGCRTRLMQGNATIWSDSVFAETGPGPPIEHDEDFAAFGGDLHAKPWTASVPIHNILRRCGERINRTLGQIYSRHRCHPIATWTSDR